MTGWYEIIRNISAILGTYPGVGTSGVPVRFNCPGEVVLFTLKKSGFLKERGRDNFPK